MKQWRERQEKRKEAKHPSADETPEDQNRRPELLDSAESNAVLFWIKNKLGP